MSRHWSDLLRGVETNSPEATEDYGEVLAPALPSDSVLTLQGDLGVGKTTFIRGKARGLGITNSIHSPTFNLYSIYSGDRQLIHCDAYRLEDPEDFEDLLLEEFLQSPWILALEWPERASSALLEQAWALTLGITPEERHHLLLQKPEA